MCKYTGKLERQDGAVDYQCVKCEYLYANLRVDGRTEFPPDQYIHVSKVYICPDCSAPHCENCSINQRCAG